MLGYGKVWYDDSAISNLFSVSDLVNRGHRVKIDTDIKNKFLVQTNKCIIIRFPVDKRGLYVKEKFDENFGVKEVRSNSQSAKVHLIEVEGFTQREVERENACRKLMHDLSARSYENLKKILLMNLIRDFPVSFGDAHLAIKICGTNVPVLKGVKFRP